MNLQEILRKRPRAERAFPNVVHVGGVALCEYPQHMIKRRGV